MGRKAGSLHLFTCRVCAEKSAVLGGNAHFICDSCKAALGVPIVRTPKQAAHKAVADAIRTGLLKRPAEFDCADCSEPAIEYDHRDYSKPLEVAPVCRRCNLRRGPAIGSDARKAKPL